MAKNAPERIHDVTRIKISGGDLVQHRRKQNEILATDQRHLYVRSTRKPFVEVHCRVKPGEPATGNDYSSRLHALTANCNATGAIKILLMTAIIQSFSHLFLKLAALEISLNFASTNDSQTGLPSLSFPANHYLFPNASFIICRARADNGPIPLPDRNHRPLS